MTHGFCEAFLFLTFVGTNWVQTCGTQEMAGVEAISGAT